MEPPGTFSLETCDFQYDKRAGRSTHHYAQALLWPEASSRQLDDASCAGTKNLCVHALMAAGPAGLEPVLIVQHR